MADGGAHVDGAPKSPLLRVPQCARAPGHLRSLANNLAGRHALAARAEEARLAIGRCRVSPRRLRRPAPREGRILARSTLSITTGAEGGRGALAKEQRLQGRAPRKTQGRRLRARQRRRSRWLEAKHATSRGAMDPCGTMMSSAPKHHGQWRCRCCRGRHRSRAAASLSATAGRWRCATAVAAHARSSRFGRVRVLRPLQARPRAGPAHLASLAALRG